ncbi:MAG TPA: twitching motility protein PilT [Gammaproteobacteria bacterium]|nr:twitching motility protein PilT [Gammaproteobacteria bacterium]
MQKHSADFRFYEELNDFLPTEKRKQTIVYQFFGTPGIKDPIESLGIPHTEVELIIVNGRSVGFDYQLRDNDRVAVYPVFESLDVTPLVRLRERPLRKSRFVVDVNLGKLARWLRLLGFDTLYRNDYSDAELAGISVEQRRILLTRDRFVLRRKIITHAYWVRAHDPDEQIAEILKRFDLSAQVVPFKRCLECNGLIREVEKSEIADQLKPLTRRYYNRFYRCKACGKVYWRGPHYEKMVLKLECLGVV